MSSVDRDKKADTQPGPSASRAESAAGASDKVGGSTATAPVDAALAQRGVGTAHASGATFHDDPTSHAAASALGARAFTAGSDVYFGAGQYAPQSAAGGQLISHELTHVEQARGVAAPEPGNFRVSSPSDGAEVAARSGSSGASAAPATIFRDLSGAPAPAEGGAGPAAGGATPAPASPAAPGGAASPAAPTSTPADPYDAFKQAVKVRDRAEANNTWNVLSAAQKSKVATEGDEFQRNVIYAMHKDAAKVLRAAGVVLTPSIVYSIFLDAEFAQWLPEMRSVGLLTPFLLAEPQKGMVGGDIATQLGSWVTIAANVGEAKAIFQKVYPTLLDTATLGSDDIKAGVVVKPWSAVAQIDHLFQSLVNFLPVGHVQTVKGFFLMDSPKGQWGWWQPWDQLVALPLHGGTASAATDKTIGHDMTGGASSGENSPTGGNTYTAPGGAPGKGKNAKLGHFEGTVLHEVGHGVGQRMGGNDYAKNPGSWPGFTVLGPQRFADELWDAPTGVGDTSVSKNAQNMDDKHAKAFMIGEITGGAGSYTYDPGWFKDTPSRADVAKWISTRYSNVPLQAWWKHMVEGKADPGNSYAWDDPARLKGGWAYGILTRNDPDRYMKFKDAAYKNKVSWYGLSSPLEWWAEQYAHYYRTEKTGGGLIDASTKAMLDRLDKQAWDDTNQLSYTVPDGASKGAATAGSQTVASAQPAQPAQKKEPLFFPW